MRLEHEALEVFLARKAVVLKTPLKIKLDEDRKVSIVSRAGFQNKLFIWLLYLRVGSVSFGIGSCQVATMFDVDLELCRFIVVLKTKLHLTSDGHRAIPALSGS